MACRSANGHILSGSVLPAFHQLLPIFRAPQWRRRTSREWRHLQSAPLAGAWRRSKCGASWSPVRSACPAPAPTPTCQAGRQGRQAPMPEYQQVLRASDFTRTFFKKSASEPFLKAGTLHRAWHSGGPSSLEAEEFGGANLLARATRLDHTPILEVANPLHPDDKQAPVSFTVSERPSTIIR